MFDESKVKNWVLVKGLGPYRCHIEDRRDVEASWVAEVYSTDNGTAEEAANFILRKCQGG